MPGCRRPWPRPLPPSRAIRSLTEPPGSCARTWRRRRPQCRAPPAQAHQRGSPMSSIDPAIRLAGRGPRRKCGLQHGSPLSSGQRSLVNGARRAWRCGTDRTPCSARRRRSPRRSTRRDRAPAGVEAAASARASAGTSSLASSSSSFSAPPHRLGHLVVVSRGASGRPGRPTRAAATVLANHTDARFIQARLPLIEIEGHVLPSRGQRPGKVESVRFRACPSLAPRRRSRCLRALGHRRDASAGDRGARPRKRSIRSRITSRFFWRSPSPDDSRQTATSAPGAIVRSVKHEGVVGAGGQGHARAVAIQSTV